MKVYYYLIGKDQNGPFTIEQLAEKVLTNETLIWTEGMQNWQKLNDIPELFQIIKPKSVPPPPPSDTNEKISKTEVSGHLKVTTEKTLNPALEAIKSNQKTLTWIIIWCSFHLFALLMSYSQIVFFNSGKPNTKNFWPFVNYNSCSDNPEWEVENIKKMNAWYEICFEGIFADYDWSEFAFYVGGSLILYFLVKFSNIRSND